MIWILNLHCASVVDDLPVAEETLDVSQVIPLNVDPIHSVDSERSVPLRTCRCREQTYPSLQI